LTETTIKGETKAVYEKPELTQVGDARDTILGLTAAGYDLDGTWVWQPNQFQAEATTDE